MMVNVFDRLDPGQREVVELEVGVERVLDLANVTAPKIRAFAAQGYGRAFSWTNEGQGKPTQIDVERVQHVVVRFHVQMFPQCLPRLRGASQGRRRPIRPPARGGGKNALFAGHPYVQSLWLSERVRRPTESLQWSHCFTRCASGGASTFVFRDAESPEAEILRTQTKTAMACIKVLNESARSRPEPLPFPLSRLDAARIRGFSFRALARKQRDAVLQHQGLARFQR